MILPPSRSLEDLTAQDSVLSRMEGWHPELRALIEQADPDNSTLLSIRVVKPGERWVSGPVTLLDDAIHATSPTGGNGANTALRDADLLRRCLIEANECRQDLLSAVDDYERHMFEYGAEAVRSSLEKLSAFAPKRDCPSPKDVSLVVSACRQSDWPVGMSMLRVAWWLVRSMFGPRVWYFEMARLTMRGRRRWRRLA